MILVTGAGGFVGAQLLARLGDEAVASKADVRDGAAPRSSTAASKRLASRPRL